MGISPYRAPLLVSMRVSLTLVIEGIVFFLFGYRQKKSWQIFLITNLLTQGFVNIMLSKSIANAYAIIIYFVLEMLVVLFELIPYTAFIDEHKKIRNFFTCLIANAARGMDYHSFTNIKDAASDDSENRVFFLLQIINNGNEVYNRC